MLYVSIIFPPYFVFEKSGKIRKSQFKSQNKLGKNSYKISQYIGEKSQGKNKRTTSRVKLKRKWVVGCTDIQKESQGIELRNATKRKGRACCFPSR
jgi:midasin (ATPase involved in ribosome maturation)